MPPFCRGVTVSTGERSQGLVGTISMLAVHGAVKQKGALAPARCPAPCSPFPEAACLWGEYLRNEHIG